MLSVVGIPLGGWGIFSVRHLLYPPPQPLDFPDPIPPVARHRFSAPDGVPFEVWRLAPDRSPKGRVLLCHGYSASRAQIVGIGQGLCTHGYESVVMELRGHGARPGPFTFGVTETREIGIILRWLRTLDASSPLPLAALGLSMGGAIVCQAAARFSDIRAVILDSVYSRCFPIIRRTIRERYRLPGIPWAWVTWWALQLVLRTRLGARDPVALAPRLHQPLLAIQGGADARIASSTGEACYNRWAGPKERWFDPEAVHVGLFPNAPEEYCRRVAAFLDRVFG